MRSVPRSLTDRERAVLDLLLSVDFPGVLALRAQARGVRAEREGVVIDLVVDAALPRATVASRTPVQAAVDGAGHRGGLVLFVDDGRLSALEHWWVTDEKPDAFPPLTAIGRPVASG